MAAVSTSDTTQASYFVEVNMNNDDKGYWDWEDLIGILTVLELYNQ